MRLPTSRIDQSKYPPGDEKSMVTLSQLGSCFIETTATDYIAIIHKEPNSDFGVSFPDFPGCITAGRTLDEAKEMALEALNGQIEVTREAGESVPASSGLDEEMAGRE
jgi:predicted RNase H-like HicB family nuclease